MTTSNILGLTELAPTMTGRSALLNEWLAAVEAYAGHIAATQVGLNTPPGTPAEGDVYVTGSAPTGTWAGQANKVAVYYNAAWSYLPVRSGLMAYDVTAGILMVWTGSLWDGVNTGSSISTGLESADLGTVAGDGNVTLDNTTTSLHGVTITGDGTDGSMIIIPTDQTDATENRPYWGNTSGAWVPITGFADTDSVTAGTAFVITSGDNAAKIFRLETTGTAGTDDLSWNTEAYQYVSRMIPIAKNNATLSLTNIYDDHEIFATRNSAMTWTIPNNATSPRSAGDGFRVTLFGTGPVTIDCDTSVVLNGASAGAGSVTLTNKGDAYDFIKKAGNSWNARPMLTGSGGDLLSTNNLSDVASAATARTNLGVDGAGENHATAAKTGAYTVTAADGLVKCDTSGGAFTVTLPAAASSAGQKVTIKKTNIELNAVTIDGNASETIDGATTIKLVYRYESVTLHCDGSNWYVSESHYAEHIPFAISDETTALTTGTAKLTWRFGARDFRYVGAYASINTVSSSGTPTFDVNDDGTSIFGANKLSIDVSEKTTATATTAVTIAEAVIAADSEITFDIDTAGTGAAGAKVTIVGFYV